MTTEYEYKREVKKGDWTLGDWTDTKVTESDGRTWRTKEPAVLYFYYKDWYNIIGQYKKTGIYFYCNIATPALIDNRIIKYIDYDLDLRVFNDGAFKILDRNQNNFISVIKYKYDFKSSY